MLSYLTIALKALYNFASFPGGELERGFISDPYGTLKLCSLVIFLETGCIFFPFLPGDPFLMTIGNVLSGLGRPILPTIAFLTFAAFIGAALNYLVGLYLGKTLNRALTRYQWYRVSLKSAKLHLKKRGNLSIFLSRWVGWIRTFSPFVAGMLAFPLPSFMFYNFLGGFFWITTLVCIGAFSPPQFREVFSTLMTVGALLTPACATLYIAFAWVKRRWSTWNSKPHRRSD